MSDEEMKMHFDIFLIENGAYEAFYRNRRRALDLHYTEFILGAFTWMGKPEGHEYWEKLHYKWEETYGKLL